MANPAKSNALLSDRNDAPLISTQQATVADGAVKIAITYSANDPSITTNGAITIADGSAATVAELLDFCEELNDQYSALVTKFNTVLGVLESHGLVADA